MAFGGQGRIGSAAAPDDLVEAAAAAERLLTRLLRARQQFDAAGAPLAATYAEGACDAMSFALEAALKAIARMRGLESGREAFVGTSRLRFLAEDGGVYGELAKPVRESPPRDAQPAIGADIAGNPAIVAALRADDVAAALMCAALAHSDWLHLASDAAFTGDALAARAIVSTIAGRTSFPDLTRHQLGGLIHRGSADALAALGWRRMTGPSLPFG